MPVLRYRDHYISVLHIPDKLDNASCIASVEIRHRLDDHPMVRLRARSTRALLSEANEQGFAIGKRWVDEHLTKKPGSSDRITTEANDKFLPVRARLRDWLASLVARLVGLISSRFAGAEKRS